MNEMNENSQEQAHYITLIKNNAINEKVLNCLSATNERKYAIDTKLIYI